MNLAILMALLSGIAVALQGSANAWIGRTIGFWETTFAVSVANAIVVGLLLLTGAGSGGNYGLLKELPWYILLFGAVMGPIIIFGLSYAIANGNATTAIALSIVAQLVLSMVIDHFGLFGVDINPINWTKLAGVGLLVLGSQLIVRG